VSVNTQEIIALYQSQGYIVSEVESYASGGTALLSISNATPGASSETESVSFFAADNLLSPAATLTLTSLDLAFSPDGTRLAVVSLEGKVLLIGVAG